MIKHVDIGESWFVVSGRCVCDGRFTCGRRVGSGGVVDVLCVCVCVFVGAVMEIIVGACPFRSLLVR